MEGKEGKMEDIKRRKDRKKDKRMQQIKGKKDRRNTH